MILYRNNRRDALTLLELLVVLTILIALGGIVVASLPGLLTRTQAATGAANVSEIDNAIRRGLLTNQGQIGDRFDSLIVGAGGEIASFVGGVENFQPSTVSSRDLLALGQLGINHLVPAQEGVENVTFDGHDGPAIPLDKDGRVCQLKPEYAAIAMERIWNLEPDQNKRYVVFGLGKKCSLVGGSDTAIFNDAPVHFSDNSQSSPKNMYSRYLIIVELDSSDELESKARYIGTAIPDQSGITGLNQQLEDFYSN